MTSSPDQPTLDRGSVWRWNPDRATGVIETTSGTLVWFHYSAFDDETFDTITIDMPVDVDIDHTPQGDFTCRASRIRRSLPSSWQR
ncbi:hypothetical protein [Nocardia australiensis]|uniref:hypothetical protein n=1 Tax=Nocardia australiensis TaxID=2887191 RepID=UPI001D14562F|nr:hypothetical protein [Nocardia australiensis]